MMMVVMPMMNISILGRLTKVESGHRADDGDHHDRTASLTSILPVTAEETRAAGVHLYDQRANSDQT